MMFGEADHKDDHWPAIGKPVGFLRRIVENHNGMRSSRHIVGRALLVALTFWALAMIVPDFYRLYQPLGSFGFYANNDGIVTDVQGPFLHERTPLLFRPACELVTGSISNKCAAFL